jgi:hypothetical protein
MGFLKSFMPVKAVASNDFMKVVGQAKKEVQTALDTNTGSFEQSLKSAVNNLVQFAKTNDSIQLKTAGEGFLKLIEQKPSRVEPYVYLAYVLFLYGKKTEAMKYIRLSEEINPDYVFTKQVKICLYSQ